MNITDLFAPDHTITTTEVRYGRITEVAFAGSFNHRTGAFYIHITSGGRASLCVKPDVATTGLAVIADADQIMVDGQLYIICDQAKGGPKLLRL